jgi:predicted acylesterase/phospholipase RssA
MLELSKIRYLVFSAGSVKGFAYLGALQALSPLWNWIFRCDLFGVKSSKLEGVSGSSIGALFCVFIVLGYSPEEMERNLSEFDWSHDVVREMSWFNLVQQYGMNDMTKIEKTLEKFFIKKGVNPKITFRDLYKETKIDLKIHVTNVTKCEDEVHDSKATPNIPVIHSLSASMSLPLLFTPRLINGQLYSDGGLKNHFPTEDFPERETLGLQLEEDLSTEITNLFDYIYHIGYCATHTSKNGSNVVKFKLKNLSIYDFNIPFHRKEEIMKTGYETMIKYMEDNIVEYKIWVLLNKLIPLQSSK